MSVSPAPSHRRPTTPPHPQHTFPIRKVLLGFGVLALMTSVTLYVWPWAMRLHKASTLFKPEEIVYNFTHMAEIFPATRVPASTQSQPLPVGTAIQLPEQFAIFGETHNTDEFLKKTGTTGLLVLQNGQIVFEQYYQGHHPDEVHISWSLAKSTLSALTGIALHEGLIHSVQDPVDQYAPDLKGTGYEGVRLKDVLQMSSGIRFNENYDDEKSDIAQLARIEAVGGSFNAYAKNLVNENKPGTYRRYKSFDTQVLAMVLRGATGRSIADYMHEKLWQPLGAEHDAWWLVDSNGMEMGFGGFNATLRDYARFGELYLNEGTLNGSAIVPSTWVNESLTMDGPHLQPGHNPQADSAIGYGYQWWIPDSPQRDFLAIGVYDQFIYVSPMTHTVIVKNSADVNYTSDDYIPTMQHVELFRAIATAASKRIASQ